MFTPAAALSLSESQKLALEALVRDGSTPQRMALRGRIILLGLVCPLTMYHRGCRFPG